MAGKIIINSERCKGCGLCVVVCPRKMIVISGMSNKNGYFPARTDDEDCTGCAACAMVCPEAIIEVLRDDLGKTIVAIEPRKEKKPALTKEKA